MEKSPKENEKSTESEKNISIQLDLDDTTAQGQYCNLTLSNFSKEEFVLDFIFLQPQFGKAKVRSRIILSPGNAKRLAKLLQESVLVYEKTHGILANDQPFPGLKLSTN